MSLTDCSLREKAAVVFASEVAFVPELSLSAVLGVGSHLQDFCIWLSCCGPRGSHRPCSWHLGKRPLHYPESSGHRLFLCCCWVALRILQRLGIIWFSAAHMKQSTFKDIQGSPQSSLDLCAGITPLVPALVGLIPASTPSSMLCPRLRLSSPLSYSLPVYAFTYLSFR